MIVTSLARKLRSEVSSKQPTFVDFLRRLSRVLTILSAGYSSREWKNSDMSSRTSRQLFLSCCSFLLLRAALSRTRRTKPPSLLLFIERSLYQLTWPSFVDWMDMLKVSSLARIWRMLNASSKTLTSSADVSYTFFKTGQMSTLRSVRVITKFL